MKIIVIGTIVGLLVLIGLAALEEPDTPKRAPASTEAPIPSFKVQ